MDFRKMLISNNPELATYIQSNQYNLSRTMMKIRYKLSEGSHGMAEKLNVSFDDYVLLESGDESISTNRYNKVVEEMISMLVNYDMKKISDKVTDDLNDKINYTLTLSDNPIIKLSSMSSAKDFEFSVGELKDSLGEAA